MQFMTWERQRTYDLAAGREEGNPRTFLRFAQRRAWSGARSAGERSETKR